MDKVGVRIFSCGLICPSSTTVNSTQSAYTERLPICLGKSLHLLWALWSQLKLISGLTPACICFQNHDFPQNPQLQASCRDLICCSCDCTGKFSFSSLVT